jgi:hypothetical protein
MLAVSESEPDSVSETRTHIGNSDSSSSSIACSA